MRVIERAQAETARDGRLFPGGGGVISDMTLSMHLKRRGLRAQAIAESFDPPRLRQLWDMEARLDRQFEKALGMLIRLQEMRMAAGAGS